MKISKKIKNLLSFFFLKNREFFFIVPLHALMFAFFIKLAVLQDARSIFLNVQFFILLGLTIVGYFVFCMTYASMLSKLYLGRFSRGAISGILNDDTYTYFPLTIAILLGLIFHYTHTVKGFWSWLFSAGIILVILLKVLVFIYRPPDKEISLQEVGWQTKQKIIKHVTNLNADKYVANMYNITDQLPLGKYMANDELRNAINLKNNASGTLTFTSPTTLKTLHYSIGNNTDDGKPDQNLKIYLCTENSEKTVFNKDASNILIGWNEYHIELPKKTDKIELRWENGIEHDIYLSISNTTPPASEHSRKNIIVIVFDGIIPQTVGLYRNEIHADNVSQFFKDSMVFPHAYAQGDWTMPNIMSIATSRYLSHHRLHDPDLYSKILSREIPTTAETLQKHGYNTFGYFGCHRTSPGYGHTRGYNRGIYRYTGKKVWYNNMDVTLNALQFLKNNQHTNNYVFLHYYGTHPFYFQNPTNMSTETEALSNMDVHEVLVKKELHANDYAFLQELYYQKYHEVDSNLAILFDYISKYEDDHTTVILTSDHGTLLFDERAKNMRDAGKDQKDRYLEEMRVTIPFMIRFPKSQRGTLEVRNEYIEGNLAVMPTVLDIAGIQPPDDIDGISVLRKGRGKKIQPKDYSISESIFKDVYELLLKTNDFTYLFRTGRNRATNELLPDPGAETFFDPQNNMVTDPSEKTHYKTMVKKILKENTLSNTIIERD